MRWDFEVGDFVITKRRTLDIIRIYQILQRRQDDTVFCAATYEIQRRDEGFLVESYPKIHLEAHYEKLPGETAKLLYGGTND